MHRSDGSLKVLFTDVGTLGMSFTRHLHRGRKSNVAIVSGVRPTTAAAAKPAIGHGLGLARQPTLSLLLPPPPPSLDSSQLPDTCASVSRMLGAQARVATSPLCG